MKNGVYDVNSELSEITSQYFKKKLLSKEEYEIIQYILNEGPLLGEDEYDTLTFIFRERRILRWSDDEILKGRKELPGKKSITLKQALTHQTHVKIDMISELNGRLVEITNFFQLAYEEEGELHLVNIDLAENHDIPTQMPREIEKLYFSDMFYSPFKMVKRMFSLGRHNRDENLLDKIIPFVSSNTSLLYQIKSEIDTIILVIERIKSYPKKQIFDQLDDAKLRISTILELSQEDLIQINNMIDDINNTSGKFDKRDQLKKLKKLIVAYINMQTINYLQKVGLNPPPYQYLPPKHTYDDTHIRGPGENPENPYNKYKHIIEEMYSSKGKGGYNVYYPVNHHFPNFFEDPQSSAILSQQIISNPGLNDIPKEDMLKFAPMGEGGSKIGAWWSAFIRRYREENREEPPFGYELFKKLFSKRKKYNYPQMLNKLLDSIEFEEELQGQPHILPIGETIEHIPGREREYTFDNHLREMLAKCEGRVDRLIDVLANKREMGIPIQNPNFESEIPIPPPPPNFQPIIPEIPSETKEERQRRVEEERRKREERMKKEKRGRRKTETKTITSRKIG